MFYEVLIPSDNRIVNILSISSTYNYHKDLMRESVSFKKNEEHIRSTRDRLCKHYKLNKSDLYKYLIRKDSYNLENKHQVFL